MSVCLLHKNLEDSEIIIDDSLFQGQTKTIILAPVPVAHFCRAALAQQAPSFAQRTS